MIRYYDAFKVICAVESIRKYLGYVSSVMLAWNSYTFKIKRGSGFYSEAAVGEREEVKARGGVILSVGASNDEKLKKCSKGMIGINPEVSDIIAPLVYTVPLQLLSYYVTVAKKQNPDQPRNLAKVITV